MTKSYTVNKHLKNIDVNGHRKETKKILEFLPLFGTAQVLGLLPIILLIYWMSTCGGGFGLDPSEIRNWHPILTSISFIYLTGNGILVFRTLRNDKYTLKLIHAGIKGLSTILAIIGTWAMVQYHVAKSIPHLFTLHSWIGLLTLIIYIIQAMVGCLAFLYPGYSYNIRAVIMPYHRFIGKTLLVSSVLSVVTGINERAMLQLGNTYSENKIEGIIINVSGILFILFSVIIMYLSSNSSYKRSSREIETTASNASIIAS